MATIRTSSFFFTVYWYCFTDAHTYIVRWFNVHTFISNVQQRGCLRRNPQSFGVGTS